MHKRFIINTLLILILLLSTGCVRGNIVVDISRTGSAELSSKLMVVSVLRDNLQPIKEQFVQDGFAVMDIKESGMEGFHAAKTFDSIADMKNLAVFKGLNVQDGLIRKQPMSRGDASNQSPVVTQPDKTPQLSVERGLFFDTYRMDVDIDLGNKYGFAAKDDNIIVKNIMSQVDLKFILKLPTKTSKNNAYQVSQDGRTLTWQLALGESNQIVAEATMLNIWHTVIITLLIVVVGGYLYLADKKRKSRGILARRKAAHK